MIDYESDPDNVVKRFHWTYTDNDQQPIPPLNKHYHQQMIYGLMMKILVRSA